MYKVVNNGGRTTAFVVLYVLGVGQLCCINDAKYTICNEKIITLLKFEMISIFRLQLNLTLSKLKGQRKSKTTPKTT